MEKTLCNCSHISVDCVPNDPVDVRCGGPTYLGFDFFVLESDALEMEKFVAVTLKSFDIPLRNINIGETKALKEDKVWTKEKIATCISKEADYLKEQAERGYKPSFRK